jgi:hypothetical protein
MPIKPPDKATGQEDGPPSRIKSGAGFFLKML